MQLIKALRIVE